MVSSWKEFTIGELCSTVSETYKGKHSEVVLINTSDVLEGLVLNRTPVKNEKLKGQFKKTFKKNDILYSEIRPANRRFAFVDFDETENYIASTKLMVIRPNVELVLPKFLFYLLTSNELIVELQHLAETRSGTFPQITFSLELAPMKVLVPPISIQEKIVYVLSSFEEKIAVNLKLSNNLFQDCQAVFKSWFIDFDLTDGKRPINWETKPIYEISNVIYGAPFASKMFNENKEGKPIIRIRDLEKQDFVTYTTEEHKKGYLLQKGDIVVGMDGVFRPYIWANEEAWLNQRVCVFDNKRKKGKMFLLLTIIPQLDYIEKTESATTVIHIGKNDFDSFTYLNPGKDFLDKFDDITNDLFLKILKCYEENRKIKSIKDNLLSKIICGQIDLNNIVLGD